MKIRFALILLVFLLMLGCKSKSAEAVENEPTPETAEIITEEEAAAAMHAIAPEPERTGEEKDESEFVAPGGENIRFASVNSYQLVEGGAYLGGSWITYYDFETKEKEVACSKEGCNHNDDQCHAWIGGDSDYAISGEHFYALQRNDPHGAWAVRLQKRALDGGTWESIWEYPASSSTTLLSKGMLGSEWAVLTLDEYLPDGSTTTKIHAVNLNDGTETEIIPKTQIGLNAVIEEGQEWTLSASLWGLSEGYCVISKSVLPADFPTLSEYLESSGPFADDAAQSAATDEYIAQIDTEAITEYACYDLTTGEKTVISSGPSGEVSGVYDQTSIYKGDFYFFKDGAIRAYNLQDKREKEIINADYIGRITVVDGQVFYVLTAGNFCELDSYSLANGTITKFTNEGNTNTIVFTVYQENGDMFAGNYNGVECWITKADYYAENFAAAQPIA